MVGDRYFIFDFCSGRYVWRITRCYWRNHRYSLFTYVISMIVMSLVTWKKPFHGVGRNIKQSFTGLAIKNLNQAGFLILGIGLALIIFDFLTGNGSFVNSMVGIGSILGITLSLISLPYLSYMVGGLLFISGIILSLMAKPKREVVI